MHSIQFRHGLSRCLGRYFTSSLAKPMTSTNLDPVQEESLKENCLLVDRNDKVVGVASKKECHLVKKDGSLPLHRAFSVFLFDQKGDLLLQKRASTKIMYPDHYTASCTGHPIAEHPEEKNENNGLGVKLAAIRRLKAELGFTTIEPSEITYLTRLYYHCSVDGKWGEHHITYVLILKKDLNLKPNPGEISEFSLIPKGELSQFLPTLNAPLTPFFNQIAKHRLLLWWNNLDDLKSITNQEAISTVEGCS
nr:isopentenyl-diphosphate Delta-isomerase 1 isoform X2 [Onthophagus taurus]